MMSSAVTAPRCSSPLLKHPLRLNATLRYISTRTPPISDNEGENGLNTRTAATAAAAGMLTATIATAAPASANTDGNGHNCADVQIPVSVGGETGNIAGTLCGPRDADTVQVLVHGYSYGRYYWDFPMGDGRYSYTQHANQAGMATLAIDRLGVGESMRPSGLTLTYRNSVDTIHQVVQAVRSGEYGSYSNVALVGHSLGTVVSYMEAGIYQDVDAVVATGGTHGLNLLNFSSKLPAILYPASSDSQLNGYGPGYTTTRPGTRDVFYHMPNTDGSVLQLDEQLKKASALGEMLTGLPYPVTSRSGQITAPVLTVVGEHEGFFCGGLTGAPCGSAEELAAFERGYLGSAAAVDAHVQQNAGHNLNLHRNAPEVFAVINGWLQRQLGG